MYRNRNMYESDISDTVWNVLQMYIPAEKPGGRPRDTDIREVVNGIVYVLNNDVSWRKMPEDLLPWQTVYDYYRKWRKNGVWHTISKVLVEYGCLSKIHLEMYATAS